MAIPKTGWNRSEGELIDNSDSSLFACISYSFFGGSHTTTYKYCFLKSLLDNIFNFDESRAIGFKPLSNILLLQFIGIPSPCIKYPFKRNFPKGN